MSSTAQGLTAGCVATVVLSGFVVMKELMGLMPQLDMIAMLTSMGNNMLVPATPAVGWVIRFISASYFTGSRSPISTNRLPGWTYAKLIHRHDERHAAHA
jgi:hypothetical protein